jgi:hypothetical protein
MEGPPNALPFFFNLIPSLRDSPDSISLYVHLQFLKTRSAVSALEVAMTNQTVSPLRQNSLRSWRDLYTAALFETDREKIPARIGAAEQAIVARARELFAAGSDTIEEDQALDDALYALRALQNCLELHSAA